MINQAPEKNQRLPDGIVLLLVLILAGIGLVMVYSAGAPLDRNPYHYLSHQAVFFVCGITLMLVLSNINLARLNKTWIIVGLMIVSFVALCLVWVPPFASPIKGKIFRWMKLGPVTMQPSELAKGAMVLFLAYYLAYVGVEVRRFWKGVAPPAMVAALYASVIVIEPDLGAAAMIGLLLLVMLFIGGVKKRILGAVFALSGLAVSAMVIVTPWRLRRIVAFLHPWDDPKGASYQIIQSIIALGSGGLTGVGLGNGRQKLYYLPEIHNDFILANLGEELGLLGILSVLTLFAFLIWRAIKITMRAPEPFVRLVGVGAASLLALQVIVNAGVVMCLLPTKGLALPFLSYGGSSALLNFGLVGLIISAGRTGAPRAARREVLNLLPSRAKKEEACLEEPNISIS